MARIFVPLLYRSTSCAIAKCAEINNISEYNEFLLFCFFFEGQECCVNPLARSPGCSFVRQRGQSRHPQPAVPRQREQRWRADIVRKPLWLWRGFVLLAVPGGRSRHCCCAHGERRCFCCWIWGATLTALAAAAAAGRGSFVLLAALRHPLEVAGQRERHCGREGPLWQRWCL